MQSASTTKLKVQSSFHNKKQDIEVSNSEFKDAGVIATDGGGQAPKKEAQPPLEVKGVKHIVAVASGKGGVGKSTVSANLAVALAMRGRQPVVLEQHPGTLDKACGEGLMPATWRDLHTLGVQPKRVHPFVGIRYQAGTSWADGFFPQGPGHGVRRLHLRLWPGMPEAPSGSAAASEAGSEHCKHEHGARTRDQLRVRAVLRLRVCSRCSHCGGHGRRASRPTGSRAAASWRRVGAIRRRAANGRRGGMRAYPGERRP